MLFLCDGAGSGLASWGSIAIKWALARLKPILAAPLPPTMTAAILLSSPISTGSYAATPMAPLCVLITPRMRGW